MLAKLLIRTFPSLLIVLASFFSGSFMLSGGNVLAADIKARSQNADIYFIHSLTCPHCAKEKVFLEKLKEEYGDSINIHQYEVTERETAFLLNNLSKLDLDVSVVPITLIGDQAVYGYLNDETTGRKIETLFRQQMADPRPSRVYEVINLGGLTRILSEYELQVIRSNLAETNYADFDQKPGSEIDSADDVVVPIFGNINPKLISLPVFTIILGLIDGFNPCAMWTLIFLISLLLGMKDRKKMWILGTAFIFSSAFVYFLFMAAWLKIFLMAGYVVLIRYLIGITAIGLGAYNVRKYFLSRGKGCDVKGSEKRKAVLEKLRLIAQRKEFVLALGGIVLLAIAVNTIELVCSAGLPAIYTKVLAMNQLQAWQYYSYLLLYIFFFMLDDFAVFIIAMVTLRAVGIESKYGRYSTIIGGIVMLAIGIFLLFKPEWLMFA